MDSPEEVADGHSNGVNSSSESVRQQSDLHVHVHSHKCLELHCVY